MSDYYAYIFVRQDISPEQQLIQFGHAACVMGKNLPDEVCPKSLNFVGIGVKTEYDLFMAMDRMVRSDVSYHAFTEPDLRNEITAVASVPVKGTAREAFKKYNTLRFS